MPEEINVATDAGAAIVAEAVLDQPVVTPQPDPQVRVKIRRDVNNRIVLECSHDLPDLSEVRAHMSTTNQRKLSRYSYYGLEEIVKRERVGISFQDWADAIGAAVMENLRMEQGIQFESNAVQEGAYLAMGDQLYRLSPVALIKQNKALAAAKQRARDRVVQETKVAKKAAQVAVAAILKEAKAIKAEAEKTLKEAQRSVTVPTWLQDSRYRLRWNDSGCWDVRMEVGLQILGYDIRFVSRRDQQEHWFHWDAVMQDPKKVQMWVPIKSDGSYSVTSIMVDQDEPVLPHVSHGRSCMSLGDAPPQIKSRQEFNLLRYSIARCMQRVNLSSLLNYPSSWWALLADTIPENLKTALGTGHNALNGASELAARLDAENPVQDEGEQTWTA